MNTFKVGDRVKFNPQAEINLNSNLDYSIIYTIKGISADTFCYTLNKNPLGWEYWSSKRFIRANSDLIKQRLNIK